MAKKPTYEELEQKVKELEEETNKRNQIESILKESEERYRSFVKNFHGIAYKGEIETWTPIFFHGSVEEITGYTVDELIAGKLGWDQMIHPEDFPEIPGKKEVASVSDYSTEREYRIIRKDGQVRWIYESLQNICDNSGKPMFVQGSIYDITDRKHAEEALLESERKYSALVQESPDAIISLDKIGNLLSFNPTAERISGFSAEEVIGKHFAKIGVLAKKSIPKALKEFTLVITGTERPPFELTIMRKDKSYLFMEANPRLIKQKGEKAWVHVTLRDISDRKQSEKIIQASLREKEVLLREIHHRVKNNMQVISSLLKIQASHVMDKQAAEKFKDSRDRITSMSLVHEQLYGSEDLTRIDFGSYVKKLVNNLRVSFGPSAEKIGVNIESEDIFLGIDVAIPLGLIVNELVSNSFKYAFPSKKKGTVTISLRLTQNNWAELTIVDSGVGMPEDFDFSNLKTFGIELVRDLAEYQLSGRIEIKHNGGTEFRIKFKA